MIKLGIRSTIGIALLFAADQAAADQTRPPDILVCAAAERVGCADGGVCIASRMVGSRKITFDFKAKRYRSYESRGRIISVDATDRGRYIVSLYALPIDGTITFDGEWRNAWTGDLRYECSAAR